MSSRRHFVRTATGLAATSIAQVSSGPLRAAASRVRLGIIGIGDRGTELAHHVKQCENAELVAFADVYTKRLDKAKAIAPEAKTYLDHRHLLDNKDVDAVIIATPQHLHAEHFVATLQAGKHCYQEKTMAFSVDHAKRMRAAYRHAGGKLAVTIGHQANSSGSMKDALDILSRGIMGRITMIEAHMFRNTPHGKPQWSRPVEPDMNPENVIWSSFLGDAPKRDFDANRFQNWRFFWDYSGGNVYENMCHQVAFWYSALKLGPPKAVTMRGGLYLWKDGREVPDTMSVTIEQPEEMLFQWTSAFGNNELGVGEHVLGTEGTVIRNSQHLRYYPQKVNRREPVEIIGKTASQPNAHMNNFLAMIRDGAASTCPFETGFNVSIASRMAVDSYRLGRTMIWDPKKEEIL
jgi:predicted dehydrogenase